MIIKKIDKRNHSLVGSVSFDFQSEKASGPSKVTGKVQNRPIDVVVDVDGRGVLVTGHVLLRDVQVHQAVQDVVGQFEVISGRTIEIFFKGFRDQQKYFVFISDLLYSKNCLSYVKIPDRQRVVRGHKVFDSIGCSSQGAFDQTVH